MNESTKLYKTLDDTFDYFNQQFFAGKLPKCLLTINRKNKSIGYYHAEQFNHKTDKKVIDEISLNTDYFTRPDKQTLSTLLHEMTHCWQFHYGAHKSNNGYHNKEWANKMQSIGLMPSNTGEPGGKKTGKQMTHYIVENESYDNVITTYLKTNIIEWFTQKNKSQAKKRSNKSKTKYTCQSCGLNVWAKPSIKVLCFDCQKLLTEE